MQMVEQNYSLPMAAYMLDTSASKEDENKIVIAYFRRWGKK